MRIKSSHSHETGYGWRRVAVAVLLAAGAAGCSTAVDSRPAPATTPLPVVEATSDTVAQPATEETVLTADDAAGSSIGPSAVTGRPAASPAGTLTQEEIAGLLLMREEEKLAHDVYVALYDLWGLRIFSNIAEAEATHMDAVRTALDRYDLDDPTDGNAAGEFTDPELQALYDELVERGSESLVAALEVGALIEDLDIVDLQSLSTDVSDVARIYANLERGSRNHLRAFVSNLERRGETYTPIYLSPESFEEIISSPIERGRTG